MILMATSISYFTNILCVFSIIFLHNFKYISRDIMNHVKILKNHNQFTLSFTSIKLKPNYQYLCLHITKN